MDISDELIYEIEMNAWRELGAQRAKEREEANKVNLTYHEVTDFSTVACTVCHLFNLETELCFNCKGTLECLNCCGCEQLEEGEE